MNHTKRNNSAKVKVAAKNINFQYVFIKSAVKALRFIFIVMFIALAVILKLNAKESNVVNEDLRRSVASMKVNSNWTAKKIKKLYKLRNYQPIWYTNGSLNIRAENLIGTFKNAKYKGLFSDEYLQPIEKTKGSSNWIDNEINLTKQAIRYIRHVMSGRFNPKKYLKEYHRDIPTYDEVKILSDLLYKDESLANLMNLEPVSRGNLSLNKLLRTYITMKEQQKGWPKVPSGKTLEMGSKGERVRLLKESLFLRGDLKEEIIDDNFDENTKKAVIAFQKRHFLETDGRVGPATLREINVPIEERINQIIIAMERTRWFLAKSRNDKRSIQVNIPSYELTAFEDNKEVLDMPIIIGRVARKTPIFSTSIYSVRFNPVWHVPRSIIEKDKVRLFRRDPGYIKRNGYKIISYSGKVINPDSIDWKNMTVDKFNFRLIQKPGKLNALGKIRFSVVDSKYLVYLHSTPDKELFAKTRRNFSSGCIRVRNPVQLAKFVFNDPIKWNEDVIIKEMEGTKTKNVKLPENIPTHITYIAVSFDNNGNPYFSPDKYNYDKNVWNILKDRSKHY